MHPSTLDSNSDPQKQTQTTALSDTPKLRINRKPTVGSCEYIFSSSPQPQKQAYSCFPLHHERKTDEDVYIPYMIEKPLGGLPRSAESDQTLVFPSCMSEIAGSLLNVYILPSED